MKKIISTLLVFVVLVTTLPVGIVSANQTTFADVNDTDYYVTAIEYLAEKGILSGYEDNTFRPDGKITKAEIAAIICRAFNLDTSVKAETLFNDVHESFWAFDYIKVATANGVINGDGTGNFCPTNNVKHEEAVKMLVCAVGLGESVETDPADWSAGYIKVAKEKGITEGSKETKGQSATRGDIAVLVYNALKKISGVNKNSHEALELLWTDDEMPPPDFYDFTYGSINNPLAVDHEYSKYDKNSFYSLVYKPTLTDEEKQIRLNVEWSGHNNEVQTMVKEYIGAADAKCEDNQEWFVAKIELDYLHGEGPLNLSQLFSADNLYNEFGEKYKAHKVYLVRGGSKYTETNPLMIQSIATYTKINEFVDTLMLVVLKDKDEGYPILKITNAHQPYDEKDYHAMFFTESAIYIYLKADKKENTLKMRYPSYCHTFYGMNTYLTGLKIFQLEIKKEYYQKTIKNLYNAKTKVYENGKYVDGYSEVTKAAIEKAEKEVNTIAAQIVELKNYPYKD